MHTIRLTEHDVDTGLLAFTPNRLTRAIRVRPAVIAFTPRADGDRRRVARFIENVYRQRYGARMVVDYPTLVSVRDETGRIVAAAGFRFAADECLFLEQYTTTPVELLVGAPRGEIVEIGNLASHRPGASMFLFMALACHLDALRARHAVITCTRPLERRLSLLGLEPRKICRADPARLDAGRDDWGTYYDSRPNVVCGDLELACRRLRALFGNAFFRQRPRLFPRLHFTTATT